MEVECQGWKPKHSKQRPCFEMKQRTEAEDGAESANMKDTSGSNTVICDVRVYCPEATDIYETEVPDVKDPLSSIAACDFLVQDATQEEIGDPTVNDPVVEAPFDPDSVCRCCLSSSRSLSTLDQSELGAGASSGARVCWECAATLARLRKFRERVDAAEALLREAEETQITSEIKSLSTLTAYTKDSYDYVFIFDYPLNNTFEPTPRQRKQTLQAGVELQETMEIKLLPNISENQEINNTDHNIKQEEEDQEVKMEVTELFQNHDYCNTTANDATTSNNDVTACYNDATTDNDEPLIHYDVKQEMENPLIENEYTVRYITEEELRERRFADRHTSRYKSSPFKCEMCICYFYSHQSMRKHMKELHGKYAGRYMCRVCQQRFAEAGALSEHCRQHYVTYCCRECGFSDRRLLNMNQHLKEHAARQSGLSSQCSPSIASATEADSVWNECGICLETIDDGVSEHYTCHYPTERPRCLDSDKEFTSHRGFVNHRQNVHLPKKVDSENKNLFTKENGDGDEETMKTNKKSELDTALMTCERKGIEVNEQMRVFTCIKESDLDPTDTLSRKRKRQPDNWKRNIMKRKREAGEEYTNTKGKKVMPKIVRPGCDQTCQYNCSTKFSHQKREEIKKKFYSLNDEDKYKYYSEYTERTQTERKRTMKEKSRRKYSFLYYFPSISKERVCKNFFCATLDISVKRVYHFYKKKGDNNVKIIPTPQKGMYVKKQTAPEKIEEILNHIRSFPVQESHGTGAQYLDPSLSVKKMHSLYVETHKEPAKENIYRKVFNEQFNFRFQRPKNDLLRVQSSDKTKW